MPDSLGWRKHPVILNYGVPVLSVGVVLIIGRWLDLYFRAAPVSLFIRAVTFSAWLGGFRPGLLATSRCRGCNERGATTSSRSAATACGMAVGRSRDP